MEMKVKLSSISDYYTAETLAEELNVSRSMAYYLLDTGKIKYDLISPTRKIIKRSYVKEYLKGEGYAITE
jgi:Zn-dependent peptidase ImmA (M78 family)